MRIAITADVHLTSRQDHPQRFRALENILDQVVVLGIRDLIIAGDLFDASRHNYAEFEYLCQDEKYKQIQLHIIPGNHDATINNSDIVSSNVSVYTQPKLVSLDPLQPVFLFLPYRAGMNMGEMISNFEEELAMKRWVLIGHGDWSDGLRLANPYEGGVYMPLSRRDILRFDPLLVFLGHIHTPYQKGIVYQPGSPCGLNISEIGKRRFLVYEPSTGAVDSIPIVNDVIYFDETIVVLPVDDEATFLKNSVEDMITSWGLTTKELEKVCLQVKVKGVTADKVTVAEILKEALASINLYADPDLSEVSIANDPVRLQIVAAVRKRIENFEWRHHSDEPGKDELLIEALAIIYGW